jgi:hypothetical protein
MLRSRRRLPGLLAALALAPAAWPLPPAARLLAQTAAPRERAELVHWATTDGSGRLWGGTVELLVPGRAAAAGLPAVPAPATTLFQALGGGPANRVDLVFVGDGYTAAELPAYAGQVAAIAASFFSKEPYTRYAPCFVVHRVDVVSSESGVDHDPVQGVFKDTALDMGYWCGGIDRLLCVDVAKAYAFANNAPHVDLVAALANSATYGGAGYPASDLATGAAGNGASLEIMRHEFGHALGNLADEYDYGGPAVYAGAEPGAPNSSKLAAAAMAAAQAKWFRWLGHSDPAFDGLVSTFEGSSYSPQGVYRPTANSLMRSLGRPFNPPSAEALVIEIYKIVDPIDAASDASVPYAGVEVLSVAPLAPAGAPLAVQWFRDEIAIPGATSTALDLATLDFGGCPATVSVRVRDETTLVRDEAARAQWLTETRAFEVVPPGPPPLASYCVAAPNSVGPGARIGAQGSTSVTANDLALFAVGAPPATNGLFFFGTGVAQTPLGDGWLCASAPLVRLPATQTNLFGDAYQALDLALLPGGAAVHPGETRHFQFWYRDVAAGGALTNTTDGLAVRFCP